jgi:hypothetical protein
MPKYLIIYGTDEEEETCQADTLEEADEVAPDGCSEDATRLAQDRDGLHYPICELHAHLLRERGLAAQAM